MKSKFIMLGMFLAATSEGGNGQPTPPAQPTAPETPVAPPAPAAPKSEAEIAADKEQAKLERQKANEAKEASLNEEKGELQDFVAFQELNGKGVPPHTLARIAEIDKELDKLTVEKKYGEVKVQAEGIAAMFAGNKNLTGSFKITIEVSPLVEGQDRKATVQVTGTRVITKAAADSEGKPKKESTGESAVKRTPVTITLLDGTELPFDTASAGWSDLVSRGVVTAEVVEANATNSKVRALESILKKGLIKAFVK